MWHLGGFDVKYNRCETNKKPKRASNAELFWRDIHHHLPFLVLFFFFYCYTSTIIVNYKTTAITSVHYIHLGIYRQERLWNVFLGLGERGWLLWPARWPSFNPFERRDRRALFFLYLDTKASHGMSLPLSSTERKETPKLIAHMTQRDIRSSPPLLTHTLQRWRYGREMTTGNEAREKRSHKWITSSKPLKSNSQSLLSRSMGPPVNILQTISREGEKGFQYSVRILLVSDHTSS